MHCLRYWLTVRFKHHSYDWKNKCSIFWIKTLDSILWFISIIYHRTSSRNTLTVRLRSRQIWDAKVPSSWRSSTMQLTELINVQCSNADASHFDESQATPTGIAGYIYSSIQASRDDNGTNVDWYYRNTARLWSKFDQLRGEFRAPLSTWPKEKLTFT